MTRGVRQVAVGMVISFFILSLGLVYWQVVEAGSLQKNPANRRLILLEQRVQRGGIFDRNGEVLAKTDNISGKMTRIYPKGDMFEPLLGYSTVRHGAAGLEGALADWLLGVRDPSPLQQVQQAFAQPRQGDDVVLTLDSRLQSTAYEALHGTKGAVVAFDPNNGDVLALVSQPGFNPNDLEANWNEIKGHPGSPLMNRAFSLYPPGSTMKVVTSASLFRAGLNTGDLFNCTGTAIINGQIISEQNGKAHGWVNYNMALADSCNTYFASSEVRAGDQSFLNAVKLFGFGQDILFELALPHSRITNTAEIPAALDANLLAASAFGQGQVMISPFHMALITAGIANHGVIMTPHIVDRVLDSEQAVVYAHKPEPWLTALHKEEADRIKSAMITAVTDGTAAPGALPDVQVAAKTGSAEPGGDVPTHAWYIAFAPADAPRIAVAVFVENGGTGGGTAAPVAQKVIQRALSLKAGDKR